jgi:hypothetical protein
MVGIFTPARRATAPIGRDFEEGIGATLLAAPIGANANGDEAESEDADTALIRDARYERANSQDGLKLYYGFMTEVMPDSSSVPAPTVWQELADWSRQLASWQRYILSGAANHTRLTAAQIEVAYTLFQS